MAKDTFFYKKGGAKISEKHLNCDGKLLDLDEPAIMGILNLTPDSFFDGGKLDSLKNILYKTEKHLKEGAKIIDLGAFSSRPFADNISISKEWNRLKNPLKSLIKEFPDTIFSIDTFRSEIAKNSVNEGASMINDISGGQFDTLMFETIALLKVPYILMHTKGKPSEMQIAPTYKDVLEETFNYFNYRISELIKLNVHDVILDPGFGFGKTQLHNYQLLNSLEYLNPLNKIILVGISRKSMIYKLLETNPENALNGTTAINSIALLKGANILRVHDVKEAMETVKIVKQLNPKNL